MKESVERTPTFKGGFRVGLVAVSVLLAVVAGMLALGGRSEAQQAPPDFLAEEGPPPPGANVACDPTREHPYPVVLVHGTFETMDQNWSVVSPRLKEEGYCVFALNYGNRGLEYIGGSARELDRFVNNVLRFTDAEKVQIVGHSQGGMMPRRYIKTFEAGNRVEDLIGFAPSNRGTELEDGITEPAETATPDARSKGASGPCFACDQQAAGSGFLHRLNKGDDTLGSASYTQIATEDDEIIIPFYRCFLKGEKNTRDLILQNSYRSEYNVDPTITHQNIYDDPVAQEFMFDALANEGPTNPDRALVDFPLP